MDLTSDFPYWTVKNGIIASFPPLENNLHCDVAVLGAGISGSLIAEALTADGHEVVMLDARDICHGSTSASTALLQYEIDTHLIDLIEQHGPDNGKKAYQACYESIDLLEEKIVSLGLQNTAFSRHPSVYLASRNQDVAILQREAKARRNMGIPVEEWSATDLHAHLGLKNPLALCSSQGAQVDAYRLAHELLRVVHERGGKIYDRTRVISIETQKSGLLLKTDRHHTVHAKRLAVASGYESSELFETAKLVSLSSSFAVASEPMKSDERWWKDCLLWESARPYFYLRTDHDGRAIFGGEDLPFRNTKARDRFIPTQSQKLIEHYRNYFPQSPMEPAYCWAGTFGETRDGLAYIGKFKPHPLCLFALGYGGNGITYSVIAAEILRHEIRGKAHRYQETFRFDR